MTLYGIDMTQSQVSDRVCTSSAAPAPHCSTGRPHTHDQVVPQPRQMDYCATSTDPSLAPCGTIPTRQSQEPSDTTPAYSPAAGRRACGVAALRAELQTLQQAVRDASAHRRPPRHLQAHQLDAQCKEDLLELLAAKEHCLEFLADNLAAAELAAYAAEQRAEAAEQELLQLRQQLTGAAASPSPSSGTLTPVPSDGGCADLTVTVRLLGPVGGMSGSAAAGTGKLSSGKLSCGGVGGLSRGAPVALVLPEGLLSQAWSSCPADTWVDPVAGDRQDFFSSSLRARTQMLTRLPSASVAGCHMDNNPLWEEQGAVQA